MLILSDRFIVMPTMQCNVYNLSKNKAIPSLRVITIRWIYALFAPGSFAPFIQCAVEQIWEQTVVYLGYVSTMNKYRKQISFNTTKFTIFVLWPPDNTIQNTHTFPPQSFNSSLYLYPKQSNSLYCDIYIALSCRKLIKYKIDLQTPSKNNGHFWVMKNRFDD